MSGLLSFRPHYVQQVSSENVTPNMRRPQDRRRDDLAESYAQSTLAEWLGSENNPNRSDQQTPLVGCK